MISRRGIWVVVAACLALVAYWLAAGVLDRQPSIGQRPSPSVAGVQASTPASIRPKRPFRSSVDATRRGIADSTSEVQEPPKRFLTVRVVAPGGDGVSDCAVLYRGTHARRRLGRTDASGQLEVDASRLEGGWLAARHPDYAQTVRALPDPLPRTVEIRLQEGVRSTGRVVLPDGTPAPEGVRVACYPAFRLPEGEGAGALTEDDPEWLSTETDADGRFEFVALSPGATYEVAAGARGWVSGDPMRAVAPFEGLTVEIFPLFGVRVRWLEQGGAPLRTSRTVVDTRSVSTVHLDPEVVVPPQRAVEAALAGLARSEFEVEGNESLYLLCGRSDVEQAEPLVLRAYFPGYAPAYARIPLPRLRDSFHVEDVFLDPIARDWTELRIRFTGAPPDPGDVVPPRQGGIGVILEAGDGSTFRIHTRDLELGRPTKHRLPTGRYRLRLSAPGLGRLGADRAIDVEFHGPTDELELPWPTGSGSLTVTAEDPDGVPLRTAWMLFFRRGDGTMPYYRSAAFDRSPGLLPVLEPGEWELWISPGHSPPPGADARVETATIVAGATTRIRLRSSWR